MSSLAVTRAPAAALVGLDGALTAAPQGIVAATDMILMIAGACPGALVGLVGVWLSPRERRCAVN